MGQKRGETSVFSPFYRLSIIAGPTLVQCGNERTAGDFLQHSSSVRINYTDFDSTVCETDFSN
ncbi:MAG TPA: hypothetical protein VGJ15_06535, partial [Pirellulales bacterium]